MSRQVLPTRDEHEATELAAGRGMASVAHDLNDQLTVICGFASLGGSASGASEQSNGYFELIDTAGQRAALLTRELIALEHARSKPS